MRPVVWLVLGGLACGGLGFWMGRSTPSRPAADGSVAQPTAAHATRPWPTVWPDGGLPLGPDLSVLFEDDRNSLIHRDVRRRAEHMQNRTRLDADPTGELIFDGAVRSPDGGRPPTVYRIVVPPRFDLDRVTFEPLVSASIPWSGAEPLSGFSMPRITLIFGKRRPWPTPFETYFLQGSIRDLVEGRWLLRRTEPWSAIAPLTR